jgi:hypothetical protein
VLWRESCFWSAFVALGAFACFAILESLEVVPFGRSHILIGSGGIVFPFCVNSANVTRLYSSMVSITRLPGVLLKQTECLRWRIAVVLLDGGTSKDGGVEESRRDRPDYVRR